MNDEADQQELSRLLKNLVSEPQTLDELWHARPMLWQDLGWNQTQLKLWLYCQPQLTRAIADDGIERFRQTCSASEATPDLAEEIAKIVQSKGKPMPLVQLKNQLPAGLLATEPMLKAAIANHPHLQVVGPMVKLN